MNAHERSRGARVASWIAVLTISTSTLLPMVAHAAAVMGPSNSWLSAGAIELTPTVSFDHSSTKREGYGNVDTFTRFDFTPSIGFCLTNRFEATSGLMLRHVRENDMHQTGLGFTAGLIYNFPAQGAMIPFAGLGFGALFDDGFTFNQTALIAPSLQGGIRLLVGGAASVNASLGYQHETDNHVSTNQLLGSVGVSLFPWRAR